MRIFQLMTFYEPCLKRFHRENPQVLLATYDEHIHALLSDGFSCGHIIGPALKQYGYDTEIVIANCRELQEHWCKEAGISFPHWPEEAPSIVARQMEAFEPDIFYCCDPVNYDSSFVRRLHSRPSLVIGWRAAYIPPQTDWSLFDLILSSSPLCRKIALERGARETEYFYPGFDKRFYNCEVNSEKQYDVVFCGTFSEHFVQRTSLFTSLAKASLRDDASFIPAFFMHISSNADNMPAGISMYNHGDRFGRAMYQMLASGRIALNAAIDFAENIAPNMRLFESAGVGTFLLTERQRNIQAFFHPGKELETFADEKELLEKIDYYLAHPEKRQAIAEKGRKRCHRDYSLEIRASAFDRLVRRRMNPVPPLSPGGIEAMTRAVKQFVRMAQKMREVDVIWTPPADVVAFVDAALQGVASSLASGKKEMVAVLFAAIQSLDLSIIGVNYCAALDLLAQNDQAGAAAALFAELAAFPENDKARERLSLLLA